MTKTFAAQIAEIRTAAQLVAYVNADSDDLPRPEVDVTDPIESRAVRALSVVSAPHSVCRGGCAGRQFRVCDLRPRR